MAMMRDEELMNPNRRALLTKMGGTAGVQAPGLQPPAMTSPGGPPKLDAVAGAAGPPDPFQFNRQSVMDILGRYEHTPAGLQRAFAENQGLAGVSQIGGSKGDKILDPTTGRYVDVIRAAGLGGQGWQWLDDDGSAPSGAPSMGGSLPGLGIGTLLTGDPSARIQQALGAFSQRSPNIEALLAQLAQGQ